MVFSARLSIGVGPDASKRQQQLDLAAPSAGSHSLPPAHFLIAVLCLAAVVSGVYAPSLRYHLILDDHEFADDPRVQSAGHVSEYFTNYVWPQFKGGPPSFYRPLFVLWVRMNFILNGMSPWGWHLLSILKHVGVALLLYFLAWRLLRDGTAALLAAILFALHPANTECVAWSTVPDPLMAIGVLTTLLLFLKYSEQPVAAAQNKKEKKKAHQAMAEKTAPRSGGSWFIASVIVCFLTMLTKETAIILPMIIFFLALFMLRGEIKGDSRESGEFSPFTRGMTRLLRALRMALPFACAAALYLLMRWSAFGGKLGSLTQHLPWRSVLLSWPAILWFYAKVLLWPVRSYAYGDPTLLERLSVRGVLLPGLAVACLATGLAAALFWLSRKARRELPSADRACFQYALVIGTLLLVFPILPALDLNVLNPGDFLHGRYVYLPSAGMALILASAWHLAGRARKLLLWGAGLLAIVFAVLTFSQESQWKDDLTLFTVAHQLAPNNPWVALNLERAHVQAALGLVEQGRCSEVLPVFERVTQEYPQEWSAWAALGYCYFTINNLPEAEKSLHRAAQLSRDARTIEMWQELRAHMGLSSPAPLD